MNSNSLPRRTVPAGFDVKSFFSHAELSRLQRGKHAVRALLANCLLLLACGIQGPPQPPRIEKPEPVTDLAVTQVGESLKLRFTLPARATDGERVTKPLEVYVFRGVKGPGQNREEVSVPQTPWVVLSPDDLNHLAEGGHLVYQTRFAEKEFAPGAVLTFAVRTATRGFRGRPVESELSNLVRITVLDVSRPVAGLEAQAAEDFVELRWRSPSQSVGGHAVSNLSGYRIYRALATNKNQYDLLGESSLTWYRDRNFSFDQTCLYKVRALFRQDAQAAESEDSLVVEITPRDVFPPRVPTGLTALYTGGAVELVWTANAEPDLAGYYVYRREDEGPVSRINQELTRIPLFRDASVEAGHRYSYRVSAVDLSNNESTRSAEVSVESR